MDTSLSTLLPVIAALLATGAAAGFLAGLLGVGGGIIVVPVLYYLFEIVGVSPDISMHLAVGTSLATIVPTSIASARSHQRNGAVDDALLRLIGPAIIGGVLLGALIAAMVSGRTLTGVFAVVALLVALNMAFGRENWQISANLPGRTGTSAMGLIIGAFSSMMGIGGGTLSVPFLTLFGHPVHKAVGTAAAIGFLIAVPGTIGFVVSGWTVEGLPAFAVGYVHLLGFALIVPASVLMAPYGARVAHGLDRKLLSRIFALFLALTSIRMFISL
ncbi:MAG: sulfite exporter TauE/SafE family protein [Alphaproteobacteria bacterium]